MSAVSEPRSVLLAPRLRPPPTTSTIDADHPVQKGASILSLKSIFYCRFKYINVYIF